MTLARFVRKNAFRNWRRTLLTVGSMAFSLALLSFLMSMWQAFYGNDLRSEQSSQRLIVRHKVSLTNLIPASYRDKIRHIPGVVKVVPMNWFGGVYKDTTQKNFFARFGTDPDEFFDLYTELEIPKDQLDAWKKDRAGAVADEELAKKYGWKLGDRIVLQGDIYPIRLELTLRGIFTAKLPNNSLYFNEKYVEEGIPFAKGVAGFYGILVDSPQNVDRVSHDVDTMFANAPEPTRTETEKAFGLSFLAMLGNVKAFILVISLAAVFTILLVSGNTMAMSIRERTREVAVLKTMGFTRKMILTLFVSESVAIAALGGILGTLFALLLITGGAHSPQGANLFVIAQHEWRFTAPTACAVAIIAGFLSSAIPAYSASKTGIVEGLRHIG
ncbi:MAG TPA: FtsX-like permease family protein [Terriglobales bacterium]|nr:FtsX-like permease family protein [Terriglobales bacterium]